MANDFILGEEGSRSKLLSILAGLQAQGSSVLTALESARVDTLVEFERRLSSINCRRQRSNRASSPQIACRFPVSDFKDIDQRISTVTIRADSQSATLRERTQPEEATVRSQRFSASKGDVEVIDATASLYRVTVVDGSTPTGTFDIELVEPLVLNVLVFDIVASPSTPTITVQASGDGIVYQNATNISLNGYRISAWLPGIEVRFVRISLTPSHPDALGGVSFSFGITAFDAFATVFNLRSDITSKIATCKVNSKSLVFKADADPNITYYLSLQGNPFIEVKSGQTLDIPGTASVNTPGVAMDSTGLIAHTLPGNTYLPTFLITELRVVQSVTVPVPLRFAPELLSSDTRINKLANEYVGTHAGPLRLIRADGVYDTNRLFNVSYLTGPASITAQLKVRITTTDKAVTPVFHGAILEEI